MHPNPSFRTETERQNIEFARKRAFGTLAVNHSNGPLLSHIPFILSQDGSQAELHLVRSNPIVRLIESPVSAVISVNGSDAYISPDWYDVDDQVPTWNYVAVHLRGELQRMNQEEMHGVLERLTADMEKRLLPKKPWVSDKMDQDIYARMQRQIIPVSFHVSEITGTWKLSQNKPDEVRHAAANGLEKGSAAGIEVGKMIELMRAVE